MEIKYIDEKALILGLKNKEASAFEALLNIYGYKILRVCYLILKDINLAEDVTQEVFILVYRHGSKFKEKSSLFTWINKIAINKCRDILKKNNKYTYFDDYDEIEADSNIENEVLLSVKVNKIKDCIFLMKPLYREIITLYYYQELSIKELCEVLNENENTVKSRLIRGRKILKDILIKEDLSYEEI
ncbi:sigma-70 family RNA polymerase sigma factor [Clostridium estertheticum]|uniref:RNA polymerase sigma factor n=1 Tax=Clostridium estertheticum TaxID=238834 RepID=UPI0013E968E9|nr:sigma-70 family RNA polymerase sigma factor [Clostridium estertheticum]MBZ9686580.1 sigma-70 family RNA polymerase sigma factor [Clostridium estertheticum]